MERVQKIISNSGYCSRRKAEDLISQGRVKVNGKEIYLGDKATRKDSITIDDKELSKDKRRYIIFNKPVGCVTALKDPKFKTVNDFIDINERVFPIGRLDYNTSGLLLLTNDGDFANNIMHPRYEINKTYRVILADNINDNKIRKIEKGMMLENSEKTSPALVKKNSDNDIEITIHEGKNRIIRRMMKGLNLRIKTLERIKIEKLTLKELKEGEYRDLSENEKKLIFE